MSSRRCGAPSAAPGSAAEARRRPGSRSASAGLSYDLGRRWIALPSRAADDHGWPDLEFRFHDAVWVRDADSAGRRRGSSRATKRPRGGSRRCWPRRRRRPSEARRARHRALPLRAGERRRRGISASVERILDYLAAGDAYQVNLARRLSATIGPGDPVWLAPRCAPIGAGAARGLARAAQRRARSPGRQLAGAVPARRRTRRHRDAADQGHARAPPPPAGAPAPTPAQCDLTPVASREPQGAAKGGPSTS